MTSFADILNKKAADIEAPKNLPVGGYITTVSGPATNQERGDFLIVEFPLTVQAAGDDVDPDSLAEYGNVAGQTIRHSFLFSKENKNDAARAEYNLRTFLQDHLGIKGSADASLGELIAEAQGQQCIAYIKHDPDKNDANRTYVRVRATAPLD